MRFATTLIDTVIFESFWKGLHILFDFVWFFNACIFSSKPKENLELYGNDGMYKGTWVVQRMIISAFSHIISAKYSKIKEKKTWFRHTRTSYGSNHAPFSVAFSDKDSGNNFKIVRSVFCAYMTDNGGLRSALFNSRSRRSSESVRRTLLVFSWKIIRST